MQIKRIRDPRIVQAVIVELWDTVIDDSEVNSEEIEPAINDQHRWYATYNDEGELVSLWYAHQLNHIMWQIHTHFREKFWGKDLSVPHSRLALKKIWINTGAKKLYALVPEFAKPVLKLAKATGFKQEGRQKLSYQKNGKIYDQIHLGQLRG